ncbi:MAG: P-II family nitrogen regulator [Nitrososphaera sp.]|nr:P-II family nitrogen regulator [Nitrososphaera sp.]
MKRIEAIIASEKVSVVNDALKNAGVSGATILEAKGRGKGQKPKVMGGRGTSSHIAEFSVRANIVTVVNDADVDKAVKAILDAASTGAPGDGKIFISTVNESVDIGSRKRSQTSVD